MPGRRPIDINQQTHDARGNLKGAVTALPDSAYALRSEGLNQFGTTTSEQLGQIIIDRTGTKNLVFADSPYLVDPYLTSSDNINTTAYTRLISHSVRLTDSGIQTLYLFPWDQYPAFDIGLLKYYAVIDLIILMELSNSGLSVGGVYQNPEDQIISKKSIRVHGILDTSTNTSTFTQYATIQVDDDPQNPHVFGVIDITHGARFQLTVNQPDTQITYYKIFGTCLFTAATELPGV
jgi:hypothetical protein